MLDKAPKRVLFTFAEILKLLSGAMIKSGQGDVGDGIEAGAVILISNPDGSIKIEASTLDVIVYPSAMKPEAQA